MNKFKKEKGITLIALVITIIILLILAGVTLNIVFNGGLIEKSQIAVDTYSEEQAREKLQLAILEYKMKLITKEEGTEPNLYDHLNNKEGITVDEDNKVNVDGYEFTIDEDTFEITTVGKGTVQTPVTPQEPVIPEPPQEPTVGKDNTEGTTHTKIGSGDYAYNNPVIPAGFETVETDLASWEDTDSDGIVDDWNNGLVIQDGIGNQFVWVPVDGTNVTSYGYQGYTIGSQGSTSLEQSLPTVILDKNNDGDKEDDQITTYGGFYIARYEAGIPSTLTEALTDKSKRNVTGIPVSKQNQIPWNRISWTQAKANAESMYTTTKVQSVLITDRMWKTTCKWLEESTPSVNVTSDSRDWGNYQNAPVENITEYSTDYGVTWIPKTDNNPKGTSTIWLLKTGHTEYTNRKNIYDLAGNLWEWTNSKYNSTSSDYVPHGGGYYSDGTGYPAAYRGYDSDSAYDYVTFRVGLFIQ